MIAALYDPMIKAGLHSQQELVVLVVFGVMAIVNLYAMVPLCCCKRKNKINRSKRKKDKQESKYRQRLNQLMQSEWLIVVAEMVEIPLQSI